MGERKIEILLTPHYHDNKYKPYSWCILEWTGSSWVNTGLCDWSESPEKAFKDGSQYIK